MELRARLNDVSFGADGSQRVTFTLNERRDVSALKDKDIRLTAVQWREKRSKDANGLLWHCLGEISHALNADKWDVYLMMLKRYGVFTYGVFRGRQAEHVRQAWRESEVVGTVDVNGETGVQMILYFGSSTYDTAEFSRLLEGVKSEMAEMGLATPAQEETERLLKAWGKA